MEPTKVLIVEESSAAREFLTELVQLLGFYAHPLEKKTDFLTDLQTLNPDLLLLGTCENLGKLKAFAEVLERERESMPIVYISDGPEPFRAEEASTLENSCCLPKTFNPSQLKLAIERMIQRARDVELERLGRTIVGETPGMAKLKKHIVRLSKADVSVLVTGESGTGKELVARAIHDLSSRAKRPFIKVNSAAMPSTLLESELFGYEKGAFTGAFQRKPGKFALAHSGSILLDEIGDIPFHLQAKLLQVLQDGELSTLGSTRVNKVDVRVFASTNANLACMVPSGKFRADLYYRLNVVNIQIPPLRERLEDLDLLCDHFAEKHGNRRGKKRASPSRVMRNLFRAYSWPGNVRELENMIQTIALLGNEESFQKRIKRDLAAGTAKQKIRKGAWSTAPVFLFGTMRRPRLKDFCREAARKAETDAITDALLFTRWNRRKAARLLDISYKALLNRIKQYEIHEAYRGLVEENAASSNH
ncbi:MAG TPA: sigma-54 dependent transcriptional regulator [Syntrophobacteria bacterium]|nr:sigma-54 dependent transcriptional regulator [Syntrophobacteria bacterium]